MKNTTFALISLLFLSVSTSSNVFCSEQIPLDGSWQFQTDRNDEGVQAGWFSKNLTETITLPGSMPENLKGDIPGLKTQWTGSLYDSSFYFNPRLAKYRQEGKVKFPFFLTPDRHYIGVAWYRKDVIIPKTWKGSRITLFLERPHTITRVWVDNKELGKDSTYCVPQVFDLTSALKPGKHTITLRIDNRIGAVNVGQDSHSVTDQTQGNWNGVVGKMLLQAGSKIYFNDVQVYPNLAEKKALIKVRFDNASGKAFKGNLRFGAKSFNSKVAHQTTLLEQPINLPKGVTTLELTLPMGEGMQTWSEFNPSLYKLGVELIASNKTIEAKSLTFGMREITILGKWFYVNGRKTQMRGTVENCDFPMTGYAPMDVASWERIFRIAKRYGLNHMRFHSFCPPEAAFEAADLVGFYLQPEGPSWPNHGSSLGDGKPVDQFLMDETVRMSKEYGNHASFTMMAVGNEPRGRWVPWVTKFVSYWKKTDSRRVYTGASVGGGWAWQPGNQFHVKAGARGLDWDRNIPESNSDFRSKIDTVSVPFVSHETGQWCVFPNFDEIKKYTGVNKALNMELFQEDLADHDMGGMGRDFMMASGKLQVLAYKHDIEKNLRTPDYAGFGLLALNDYSGQGTALVGVLDVFWDEKGYCTDRDFRQFCGPVVPLIRTSKFVWQSNEHLTATAELSYFGAAEKQAIKPTWVLKNAFGVVVAEGKLTDQTVEAGLNIPLGSIDIDLSFVQKADKYTLEVATNTCEGFNSWNFYFYPAQTATVANDIYVANTWDEQVVNRLAAGKDVLLLAAGKITYGREVVQTLSPIFWNTSWFKMRPPHTTGILVNPNHPVFKDFPTETYADLQWWEIVNRSQVMQFTDFPKGFQPLIQSIDTWFVNRKIGMLFEAKVGQGRLIVCSADLQTNLETRPVARQLLFSICNYMKSNKFRPEYTVDTARVSDLFTKVAGDVNMFTKDSPDELKPKLNATQNK